MADELKTAQGLLDSITDNQQQLNTWQDLRNIIYSLTGVGAGESNEGVDPQANGTATNIEVGKGLDRLGNRRFRVRPGGDGTYVFFALGQADIDIEANVNVAIVVDDAQTIQPNIILKRRMYPGAKNEASNFIVVADVYQVVEGNIVELQFAESGGANVSNTDYIYFGFRIG